MNKQFIRTTTIFLSFITLLATTAMTGHGYPQNQPFAQQTALESNAALPQATQHSTHIPPETCITKTHCWITVWIHGTAFNPVFRKFHASPPGLCLAETLPSYCGLKKTIKSLCNQDPDHFDHAHFYTFGWSGNLSPQARAQAGQDLRQTLEELVEEYSAQGYAPRIRLITHSHGGNVALNLACEKEELTAEQDEESAAPVSSLSIDTLILLACPVQQATEQYITSPMFKKIYSFYSDVDLLQVMDPQGLHHGQKEEKKQRNFFSKRRFLPQDNLIQARVKFKGRSLTHVEFIMNHIVAKLPDFLRKVDDHKEAKESLVVHG